MEHLKITDLSIGDWVAYEDRPYRIYAIEECGTIRAKYEDEETLRQLQKHIDYFEPIPITPEILEKNGFEENGGRWYNSNWMMEFEQYKDGWDRTINCGEYSVYFIKHVHQLQNAMRLAGIDKEIEL